MKKIILCATSTLGIFNILYFLWIYTEAMGLRKVKCMIPDVTACLTISMFISLYLVLDK